MKAELVLDVKTKLGEGPCWDADNQLLYFVDIEGKEIYKYNPTTDETEIYDVGQDIGALSLTESGDLIVAMQNGFYLFNLETEKLEPISDPENHLPRNRFNDGKADPAGRFWAGTMSYDNVKEQGSLYCLSPDLTLEKKIENVTISNGLAWSPDFEKMYYIDTPTHVVVAFDYDKETGEISNKKEIIKISGEGEGGPDGMTIDKEGMLWIAQWGGYKVSRWDPTTGTKLGEVAVPAKQVTSCTFGGRNLDVLYITTASTGLNEHDLKEQPHAGGLFRVQTNVQGMPSDKFGI